MKQCHGVDLFTQKAGMKECRECFEIVWPEWNSWNLYFHKNVSNQVHRKKALNTPVFMQFTEKSLKCVGTFFKPWLLQWTTQQVVADSKFYNLTSPEEEKTLKALKLIRTILVFRSFLWLALNTCSFFSSFPDLSFSCKTFSIAVRKNHLGHVSFHEVVKRARALRNFWWVLMVKVIKKSFFQHRQIEDKMIKLVE